VVEQTYLGESVQLRVEVGSLSLLVAVHNPGLIVAREGELVTLSIRPEDVVVVKE
jgi:TOBE domain